MTTIDIIYDQSIQPYEEHIRAQIEQHGLTIHQIAPGNPLSVAPSSYPCIHIVSNSYGINNQEHLQLCALLDFRFRAAELALNAHSIYTQILIGMAQQSIHVFVPNNDTLLVNLGFVINQIAATDDNALHTHTNATPTPKIDSPPEASKEANHTIRVSQIASEEPPKTGSIWEELLLQMGGHIDHDAWADIPPELHRIAPVRNVLEQAGTRKKCTFTNGSEYTLFAYPDFQTHNAKVLLIGTKNSQIEIIALHRSPQKVGVVSAYGCGWLPQKNLLELSKEYTGKKSPTSNATIFALDSRSMYYVSDGTVYHWDGKRERNFGTPNQTLASLVLQWSQR